MIIYREAHRDERTPAKLQRLQALLRRGDPLALLVELGELEQGVLDALYPCRDGWGAIDRQLRRATLSAARAFLARREGQPLQSHRRSIERALARLQALPLPPAIRIFPPEGYVHYALDPAAYAGAASCYRDDAGAARAARALVVGVRSIGTSLSAVVAAAVGARRTITVRPRGSTGGRHVAADDALLACVRRALARGSDVLVVDEGPGATGETLACVADWLRAAGAGAAQIVLLPSRTWGMPLAPPARRQWFAAARKYELPGDEARPARAAARAGVFDLIDLSEGRWRAVVPGAAGEPACTGHERRKYLGHDARGRRYAVRYAGLGSWGEATVCRARALAAAGLGPQVVGEAEGFMVLEWVDGSVRGQLARGDRPLLEALQRYLAGRLPLFRTGAATATGPAVQMLAENAAEALGAGFPGLAQALRRLEQLPEREAVIADARLQAREWVCTASGWAKVDSIDHGQSLRLPGPTDVAWDIAGAAVEFGLSREAIDRLVRRCAAALGESRPALAEAVAAYGPAYAALGLGEALLGSWEATSAEDKRRLEAKAARYRHLLAILLRRLA